MTFKHPTGNTPKTVALVCCGTTVRDFLAVNMAYDPIIPGMDETWTLNKALRMIKADFGFVLDDLIGEHNKSKRYFNDIVKVSEETPIVTTSLDMPTRNLIADVNGPTGTRGFTTYPIEEIAAFLGDDFLSQREARLQVDTKNNREAAVKQLGADLCYFKNSVPMILAYALFIGVETIYIFGADYSHPSGQRREADQPNAEYWVGYLRGRGLQVVLSPDTTLCSNRDGRAIYGYGARQPVL